VSQKQSESKSQQQTLTKIFKNSTWQLVLAILKIVKLPY